MNRQTGVPSTPWTRPYFKEEVGRDSTGIGRSRMKNLFNENIGSHASILTDKEWKIGGKVLSVDDEFVALETTDSEQILHVALSKVVCVYFQIR
jgi:hypothetical protein